MKTTYISQLQNEFKSTWKQDLISGFIVSLVALPLCLGIAGASSFPPVMGILTAIVGGIVVSLLAGSSMTIKGPAAGLIVIVSGCVEGFGGGTTGWELTLAVGFVAGIIQILFGYLKVAKLADIFPLSAVHGLLAAIGVIIISRQFHLLLGEDPTTLNGHSPLELLLLFPDALQHYNASVLMIGLTSLALLYLWPMIPFKKITRIPASLVVIVISIVMAHELHLSDPEFAQLKPLVQLNQFDLQFHLNFNGLWQNPLHFIEYVILFVIIGSLEALLSNKAIDLIDPLRRRSNNNQDLKALGVGNSISALLGGLPMISEIARSTSNVLNGGKSRFANFFHGLFLLIFVLLLIPVIRMIPIAALSAMLIYIGFKLASAQEFRRAWSIGKDQFAIFLITLVISFATDLLLGVLSGIALEFMFHMLRGMNLSQAFKATMHVTENEDSVTIAFGHSLVFTNLLGVKKTIQENAHNEHVIIDLSRTSMVDHTSIATIENIRTELEARGVQVTIAGLEDHKRLSSHQTSTAYKK
jgi:MFS superfamily sulfate permease-like transporter